MNAAPSGAPAGAHLPKPQYVSRVGKRRTPVTTCAHRLSITPNVPRLWSNAKPGAEAGRMPVATDTGCAFRFISVS
jgi:hypothetical protein